MADYSTLKAAIADYVKDRTGLDTIDGDGLQETLLAMVNSLGANYQFAGIATPTTNPGTPDQKVFYIAAGEGQYANFGSVNVFGGELAIITWDSAWSKISICSVEQTGMVRNLIQTEKVLSNYCINSSGVVTYVYNTYYRIFKVYLKAGKYYIKSPAPGSQRAMWEYSDATYETPIREIVGNSAIDGLYTLTAGYYAISWEWPNPDEFPEGQAYLVPFDFVDTEPAVGSNHLITSGGVESFLRKKASISSVSKYNSGFRREYGPPIYKTDGSIVQTYYRLFSGPIKVTTGDIFAYVIDVPSDYLAVAALDANGQLLLANSVAGIGSTNFGKYVVPEGVEYVQFQAMDSVYGLDQCYTFVGNIYRDKNIGAGNFVFSDAAWANYSDSFTLSADEKTATSTGVGYANRMEFKAEMFQDVFDMSVYITPLTADGDGHWEHIFGIDGYGAAVSVGRDASGVFVKTYSVNGGFAQVQRIDGSGLRLMPFSIRITKEANTIVGFTATITDSAGKTITIARADTPQVTMQGKIFFASIIGTAKFENCSFGYGVDLNDVNVVVMGHSFVEGATMIDTPTARFANLIRQEVGEKKCAILGEGGIGITNLLRNYLKSLYWLRSARYVVIYIGYNDTDNADTTALMQLFNDCVLSFGMMPVWFTVAPERDGSIDPKPIINAYIKANFNHVDVQAAFLSSEDTPDPAMYHDSVHPSAQGHQRLYNLLRAKYNCIFHL